MGFDFKKWLGILTMVAPVILMVVPGGAALAPLIPVIVTGIADAQKKPGATGVEKKAFVMQLVKDTMIGTELVKPGLVDPVVLADAASQAIDAVIATVNAISKAHAALPTVPSLVPTP